MNEINVKVECSPLFDAFHFYIWHFTFMILHSSTLRIPLPVILLLLATYKHLHRFAQ